MTYVQQVEEALPALRHREHPVRAVAVQEEGLEEDRELPVRDEEDEDGHGRGACPVTRGGARHGFVMTRQRSRPSMIGVVSDSFSTAPFAIEICSVGWASAAAPLFGGWRLVTPGGDGSVR